MNDIKNLIRSLLKDKTAEEVAEIFGRERKWVYLVERGSAFTLDKKFLSGLKTLGYELKLVKISEKEGLKE